MLSLIPLPTVTHQFDGYFSLGPFTTVAFDEEAEWHALRLRFDLRSATGFPLRLTTEPGEDTISLRINPSVGTCEEAYRLIAGEDGLEITGASVLGLGHGIATLKQLLPPGVYRKSKVLAGPWRVPGVRIEDSPRFRWRGAHLDVARHFMPKEFILKFIDLMVLHKLNVLHWHLTDDQGWRIEILKYPKLTSVGAYRNESMAGHYEDHRYDGRRHGGFYTQADVREVVAYARDRGIVVMPEIEMPGHAQAAIAAYPELGNLAEHLTVGTEWGVYENVFNVEESTIRFAQDVLDEVLELFPSHFIHVGGDECPKTQWRESPRAQARMKELGLRDEDELQSWFIRRMDSYLADRGRRLVGWDEILEGGLAPGATVMSWRGEEGGIAAAKAGHDVIMTPGSYTYLDHYQGPKESEPVAIGGYVPLEKVYAYEPIPDVLSDEETHHVLGAQGQLWTEYMPNQKHAEYMAFPRLSALAEVLWSPGARRDYGDFRERLPVHLARLDALDVNYRHPDQM